MKNYLLIPSKYKAYGWALFLISLMAFTFCYQIYPRFNEENSALEISSWSWVYSGYSDSFFNSNIGENVQKELMTSMILIGLLMISFSKEKQEDEYITLLRLKSWQWAVVISYGILFLANLLIYGTDFLGFMTYNTLTILLVFIAKFNFSLFMWKKERSDDEK
jgi:hypothetical protein